MSKITHLSLIYCPECGHDQFTTHNIIKGNGYRKRVDRCTCKSCGWEWTKESDMNERFASDQEEEIREQSKPKKTYASSREPDEGE